MKPLRVKGSRYFMGKAVKTNPLSSMLSKVSRARVKGIAVHPIKLSKPQGSVTKKSLSK